MDARINVVTLAVSDLDRALAFYRHSLDRPWGIYSGYLRDLDGHL